MDLSPIIPLIPTLIETGKSIIELAKPFIKGNGFELPQDLENKIAKLEHDKNADEIIALLKDFEKNCNNTTITQTSYGQGAINIAGGKTTINQLSNSKNPKNDSLPYFEFKTSEGHTITIQEDKKAQVGSRRKFTAVAVDAENGRTEYKFGPFEIEILAEDLLGNGWINETESRKIIEWGKSSISMEKKL